MGLKNKTIAGNAAFIKNYSNFPYICTLQMFTMEKRTVKDILEGYKKVLHHDITVQGWVRAFRSNRFIALNDGSTINNLQIVVDFENFDEAIIKKINTATSLKITGEVVESQGAGQTVEILAKKIVILGDNFSEELQKTILQPKKHSLEKLREAVSYTHLRAHET